MIATFGYFCGKKKIGEEKTKKSRSPYMSFKNNILYIFIYNILSLSGGGRPFHPFVPSSIPSSIYPSSSSRKKKMMEEEDDDDEWRQQQFIQMFM
jgi:hypothetical protein